jgi:hypothetical protein
MVKTFWARVDHEGCGLLVQGVDFNHLAERRLGIN